jgi:mannose-6-phosphate isomerase-like protein (cupin superfamily)
VETGGLHASHVYGRPPVEAPGNESGSVNQMQIAVLRFEPGFHVSIGNSHAQAAQMTLAPGESEGGPHNRHRGSDQWLFVVAGRGTAIINEQEHTLRKGSLVLIEHGDAHEIRCDGRTPLRTLNIYTPPAYSRAGQELPAGSPPASGD